MIWSHPPEPRKNTRPMWYVLAKPSIAIAFGLYTAPNGTVYKPNAIAMDGFASTYHIGLVFFRGSGGWDQIIEAKCEACGTNLFDETYRSQSAFSGVRRIGWTG